MHLPFLRNRVYCAVFANNTYRENKSVIWLYAIVNMKIDNIDNIKYTKHPVNIYINQYLFLSSKDTLNWSQMTVKTFIMLQKDLYSK